MKKLTNPGTESSPNADLSSQEISQSKTSFCDIGDYDDKLDKLVCLLCGFRSNQLGRHITGSHKITTHEYKTKFPGARVGRLDPAHLDKMINTKRSRETRHKQRLREKQARANELRDAGFETIKCRMCDFESMSSIISHITNKHNISLKEYREMFVDVTVQRWAPSQKSKMSEIMSRDDKVQKLLAVRSYPSEVKHWLRKGHTEEEARDIISKRQVQVALKQNNPATKRRQSERHSGQGNAMSLSSIASRHGVTKEDASKLTPCYDRKGEKHPMFGKHHNKESLEKIAKNTSRHFSQKSSAEREIYEKLISLGYSVSRNVGVSRYNCDIVFNSSPFIIEYFGDFWHCNPNKWDAQQFNPRIKMTAEERWVLDKHKIECLETLGYKVLVVWEGDWKKRQLSVIKEIVDAANSVSRQG